MIFQELKQNLSEEKLLKLAQLLLADLSCAGCRELGSCSCEERAYVIGELRKARAADAAALREELAATATPDDLPNSLENLVDRMSENNRMWGISALLEPYGLPLRGVVTVKSSTGWVQNLHEGVTAQGQTVSAALREALETHLKAQGNG